MKKNRPSIFDFASNKKTLKKKSLLSSASKSTSSASSEANAVSDKELTQMLEKMNDMRRDIQKKMEEVYSTSGISPYDLQSFLDDPQNRETSLWKKIQQQRSEVTENLHSMLGKAPSARGEKEPLQTAETELKKRKGKLLGTRKKWIPVK